MKLFATKGEYIGMCIYVHCVSPSDEKVLRNHLTPHLGFLLWILHSQLQLFVLPPLSQLSLMEMSSGGAGASVLKLVAWSDV